MKAKEYIIQKLVQVGKKHRWMKYPMLALVSLISLFFLIIEKCMERPKRAVIALVCVVLIVSQSWYLISIASETDPDNPATNGSSVSESGSLVGDDPVLLSGGADPAGASSEDTSVYSITYVLGQYGNANDPALIKSLTASDLTPGYALPTIESGNQCYKLAGWSFSDGGELIASDKKFTVDDFSGNKSITVYAVWQLKAYELTFDPGEGEGSTTSPVYVEIVNGVAPKVTLSNQSYTRTGYTFDKWMINGDKTNLCNVGAEYTITGTTPKIVVTPYWEPITYTIEFNPNGGEGEMTSMSVKYDEEVSLSVNTFTKAGYSFLHWISEEPYNTRYDNGSKVKNLSTTNGDVVTMFAQWGYKRAVASTTEINASYNDSFSEAIDIYHNTVGDGQLEPSLAGVSGTTLDGAVDSSNYGDITGLTIDTTTNQITISANDGVKTVGDMVVSFNIYDSVNKDEGNNPEVSTIDITVHLAQKQLYVVGVDNKTKMYDGTAQITVGSILYSANPEATTHEPITGITVNNLTQKGTFTGGNQASQAGENKTILLEDVYVYGTGAEYYSVNSTANVTGGSITKRQVRVTTSAEYDADKDYILTGQAPKFITTVNMEDLPEVVAGDDEMIIKNAIDNGARNYYLCDYGVPDANNVINYSPGTFTINIDVDSVQLNNYYLQVTTGKLKVIQETPTADDYSIIGNLSEDGKWYYGELPYAATKRERNYDMVYIMTSSDNKAATFERGLFDSQYEITEEMAKGDIYLQLGNSSTNAVSNILKLNIKVDATAPTIKTDEIEITPINTTGLKKIGNFLSFGNFFKEELQVTVPVADLRKDGSTPSTGEVSGAKNITYYLGGDLTKEGTIATVENGVATFKIPMNFKGEIAFTTRDNAGNVSNSVDLIGVEGSEYWVIENTAPEVVVTAVDSEGNTAFAGEGNYYKTVKVNAAVTDADAGIAYVLWNVTKNGEVIVEDEKEAVTDATRRVFSNVFTKTFTESGSYTVAVTAYDNADNVSLAMEPVAFVVDGTEPTVTITPEDYDATWSTSKTITFRVEDLESGIDMMSMKDPNGVAYPYSPVAGEDGSYTATVTKKGTYTIKVVDRAGNVAVVPVVFTKVSDEIPDNPVVTISPEIPEDIENVDDYWYSVNPTITITEPETTPDGTEIITYYHIWQVGTDEPTYNNNRANGSFQLPGEGIWNLRVWAESESGKKNQYDSEEDGLYQIRYDGTKPVISDVVLTGNGTTSRISLKVTEATSGLSMLEAIYNGDDDNAKALTYDYKGNGVYTASFTASMQGSYTVRATDMAGNVCEADAFEPMSITVTGITSNTEKGITVTGKVTAGTFEIDNVSAKFGLEGGDLSVAAEDLIITTDEQGNKAFTAKFKGLTDDTRYRFLITALSTNGESCSYTGAFKTGVADAVGVNVAGTVIDETMSSDDTTEILIMLYDEHSVIQSRNVRNGGSFIFTNVPDGMYTIQAVNGNRSATEGVIISANKVVDPSGAITLRLRDGQTTNIEFEDDSIPKLIISGLDDIFDDPTNFGGLQDNTVINAGGTVEFCMKVDGLSESDVPVNDLAGIQHNMKKNETVAMYLDLSIWKRAIGPYGVVAETQVTSIAGGKTVRIVIPLSRDLASKEGLSVLRVHDGTVERLVDLDLNPNTYTIESALFSTYALVYTDDTKTTENDPNSSTDNSSDVNNGGNGNNSGNGGINNGGSASTSDISKKPNTGNTVTSGSSPKTGDATPIAMVFGLMIIMGTAGIVLLKNKKR